jgi:AraC-like DNA-binding protein
MRESNAVIARIRGHGRGSIAAVTEIHCPPNFGRTKRLLPEDAYLVGLHLRACHDHDLYLDGCRLRATNCFSGATSIYDLKRDPVWDMRDACHCLMLYLPQGVLDDAADDAGASRIRSLCDQPGIGFDDPIVRHLLCSLLPAFAQPDDAPAFFVTHVIEALVIHVARLYGGLRFARAIPRGGLASWQEQRAKELMSFNLSEIIPLNRLAAECGLSVRHFSRAFRQSTGMPPHRWLLKHRVERAAELLSCPAMPLVDIAISCGFADQSHFTRVFTALKGASPNVWRRTRSVGGIDRSAHADLEQRQESVASIRSANALREVER